MYTFCVVESGGYTSRKEKQQQQTRVSIALAVCTYSVDLKLLEICLPLRSSAGIKAPTWLFTSIPTTLHHCGWLDTVSMLGQWVDLGCLQSVLGLLQSPLESMVLVRIWKDLVTHAP